ERDEDAEVGVALLRAVEFRDGLGEKLGIAPDLPVEDLGVVGCHGEGRRRAGETGSRILPHRPRVHPRGPPVGSTRGVHPQGGPGLARRVTRRRRSRALPYPHPVTPARRAAPRDGPDDDGDAAPRQLPEPAPALPARAPPGGAAVLPPRAHERRRAGRARLLRPRPRLLRHRRGRRADGPARGGGLPRDRDVRRPRGGHRAALRAPHPARAARPALTTTGDRRRPVACRWSSVVRRPSSVVRRPWSVVRGPSSPYRKSKSMGSEKRVAGARKRASKVPATEASMKAPVSGRKRPRPSKRNEPERNPASKSVTVRTPVVAERTGPAASGVSASTRSA